MPRPSEATAEAGRDSNRLKLGTIVHDLPRRQPIQVVIQTGSSWEQSFTTLPSCLGQGSWHPDQAAIQGATGPRPVLLPRNASSSGAASRASKPSPVTGPSSSRSFGCHDLPRRQPRQVVIIKQLKLGTIVHDLALVPRSWLVAPRSSCDSGCHRSPTGASCPQWKLFRGCFSCLEAIPGHPVQKEKEVWVPPVPDH